MILHLRNLRAHTVLGVYDFERQAKREVIVNVRLVIDAARAVASDALEDTLDYAALERRIVESLDQQQFQLLESLADHVARLILAQDGVREATVTIDKPGATPHAESVAVEHTLTRRLD